MSDESILGYSLNQMKFFFGGSLSYHGVHKCYVSDKETHRKSKQTSSRSMYHLELTSEGGGFKGVLYVSGEEFDRARKGKVFEEYSIVTSRNNIVRFSREMSEEDALKDVRCEARKISIQTLVVLVFLGIPTLLYLAHTFKKNLYM